ncbi:replication-relaxation family protein [Thermodesulfobacteriota bacterium]
MGRKKRLVRDRSVNVRLTPRDFKILQIVLSYRFIRTPEIVVLIGGSAQRIKNRLRKLYDAGYLARPQKQKQEGWMNKPAIYAMGDQIRRDVRDGLRGAEEIEEKGINLAVIGRQDWTSKNREVRSPHIEHALMTTRFRVCLELACRQDPDAELLYWYGDRQIKDRVSYHDGKKGVIKLPVHPDGFFCLRVDGEKKWYFFEADRHTETQIASSLKKSTIYRKMLAYWEFWKKRRFKEADSPFESLKMDNFRVLFVAMSDARALNIMESARLADPKRKGSNMFMSSYQAKYDDLKNPKKIIEPIWRVPTSENSLFGLW